MKYTDIIKSIERQILDGLLKPGGKLPSIRALTKSYSCSKNTAIRAYAELEKRHIIYAVPKSGYYIVEGRVNINRSNSTDQVIDFRSAGPDKSDHALPRLSALHEPSD
ncbi:MULTISPECIES: winged helix-turn-helix domain-containing protein [Paenibacillus]|uniref:winged helix-turn-helix domain-containing protein n=1 Tax=Paenibacillus TaxID=44249 RepID=UPI0026CE64AB|nr:winged helix-turn-helix domain-containing protein [Paenibacillus lautus]